MTCVTVFVVVCLRLTSGVRGGGSDNDNDDDVFLKNTNGFKITLVSRWSKCPLYNCGFVWIRDQSLFSHDHLVLCCSLSKTSALTFPCKWRI